MSDTPPILNPRQEKARADFYARIRQRRQDFYRDFPDGCRVEFRRGSTPDGPTIRTGKGTIVRKKELCDGRVTRIFYTLDDFPSSRVRECEISTFLHDQPVRIDGDL
jgi:hypothetical protein